MSGFNRCKFKDSEDWYSQQAAELLYDCPDCCGSFIAIHRGRGLTTTTRGTSEERATNRMRRILSHTHVSQAQTGLYLHEDWAQTEIETWLEVEAPFHACIRTR